MSKDCRLVGATSYLVDESHVQTLFKNLQRGTSRAIFGLPSAAHVPLVAATAVTLGSCLLLVTAYPDRAVQLVQELPSWLPDGHKVLLFPAFDNLPYEAVAEEDNQLQARLAVLRALGLPNGSPLVVVAPARALLQPLLDPAHFHGLTTTYKVGDRLSVSEELQRWEQRGYTPVDHVNNPGEFARRGGIVDVFPGDAESPIRIELFGDDIDSMRQFDPLTQRSSVVVSSVTVTAVVAVDRANGHSAANELRQLDQSRMLPNERARWQDDLVKLEHGTIPDSASYLLPYLTGTTTSILSYLPSSALIVVDEPTTCIEAQVELAAQARDIRDELAGRGELPIGLRDALIDPDAIGKELDQSWRLELTTVRGSENGPLPVDNWENSRVIGPALTYASRLRNFLEDTLDLAEDGKRVVVASLQSARLSELYHEHETGGRNKTVIVADALLDTPAPGTVTLVQGSLQEGFQAPTAGLYVFSDAEIFGWARPAPAARFRRSSQVDDSFDFKPGDYLVHIEHGIGRFSGVEKRVVSGSEREYLEMQYAGTDRLFVPTDQLDRVTRYVGMGEGVPQLSRLGTAEWTRAKTRVKEAVAKVARELLDLYSFRKHADGRAFSADGKWQQEMEASFPYTETLDQLKAINDVKADMEAPRPMDRLVCGDVGYGKTEVALRAAFKAVSDGCQVAVLVPTTILAQQHYDSFRSRFEAYPVKIGLLSRFQSPSEIKKTVAATKNGDVDIVIGTHRLLQKDVDFKDLGLLIIDEEQRFGVKHKEFLKIARRSIDVLTLTATPIPRSLHMGMVGVRDMSVIETPPEGRLPIRTYLQPFDEYHIREAILRELDRRGQVYVVHNKVQTIQAIAERFRHLVPEARVAIAHGQMGEEQLERVITEFARHESDILVCSTIIENGLDIPNANTMIVNDAPHFGLAQLYQLRGRIGRSSTRAYAYLLYKSEEQITHLAERRLKAIFEATDLGAGFRIAMKDLEIRGAGNLLGAEQSGNMTTVGFDLYSRLLRDAISERKSGRLAPLADAPSTAVDLPLDTFIPSTYVQQDNPRLALYQRIASAKTEADVDQLHDEMRDRFGPLPVSVANLLYVTRVKALASYAGLAGVSLNDSLLLIRGRENTLFDRVVLYKRYGVEAKIVAGSLRLPRPKLGREWMEALLVILRETADATGTVLANRAVLA